MLGDASYFLYYLSKFLPKILLPAPSDYLHAIICKVRRFRVLKADNVDFRNTFFKAHGGKLKVRASMASEGCGIELQVDAVRLDFVVYLSLAPKSYACTTATMHCPAGALFSEAQFRVGVVPLGGGG